MRERDREYEMFCSTQVHASQAIHIHAINMDSRSHIRSHIPVGFTYIIYIHIYIYMRPLITGTIFLDNISGTILVVPDLWYHMSGTRFISNTLLLICIKVMSLIKNLVIHLYCYELY